MRCDDPPPCVATRSPSPPHAGTCRALLVGRIFADACRVDLASSLRAPRRVVTALGSSVIIRSPPSVVRSVTETAGARDESLSLGVTAALRSLEGPHWSVAPPPRLPPGGSPRGAGATPGSPPVWRLPSPPPANRYRFGVCQCAVDPAEAVRLPNHDREVVIPTASPDGLGRSRMPRSTEAARPHPFPDGTCVGCDPISEEMLSLTPTLVGSELAFIPVRDTDGNVGTVHTPESDSLHARESLHAADARRHHDSTLPPITMHDRRQPPHITSGQAPERVP